MTSFHVICGLGLPQSKILGMPINWRSPEKLFWRLFFENTCGCVLGPWPWPRVFLFLASRGSVLGKAVLGLGLGFFWCPWPWPRVLCPRFHLCILWFSWISTKNTSIFKIRIPCDVITKKRHFLKICHDVTMMTSYTQNPFFSNNFGEHQHACQIWCSHDFWFMS